MSLECIDSNITNPWSNLSSGKGICESNNILVFICSKRKKLKNGSIINIYNFHGLNHSIVHSIIYKDQAKFANDFWNQENLEH